MQPAPSTMLVQIKFTKPGASSVFGAFAPGDLLRCSVEAARHFVEDAACAVYVEPQPTAPAPVQAPALKQRKTKTLKD